VLTACSGGQMTDPSATPSASASSPSPQSPAATPSGQPVPLPSAYWDAIVADLAGRGVTGTPELVSAEAVTWGDGSLGCPEPGKSYTQALEEGLRVIVVVDGVEYDYRFGSQPVPHLCEN
jgi:hypothetical protein